MQNVFKKYLEMRAANRRQSRINRPGQRKQAGAFDLMSVLIAVIIIGILASVVVGNYSGDATKATSLTNSMLVMGDNLKRAKADMGCFPNKLQVLWDKTQATTGNMFCGLAGSNTWSGPYIDTQQIDATSGAVLLPSVGDSIQVSIAREAGGNLGYYYYLRANSVPNPIIAEALKKCNGNESAATATFGNSKCRATPGTGGTEFGSFDVKVEESR